MIFMLICQELEAGRSRTSTSVRSIMIRPGPVSQVTVSLLTFDIAAESRAMDVSGGSYKDGL